MDWMRKFGCNLMHSILGGVLFSALYYELLSTRLHGLAVKALSPAFDFQYRHDPYFDVRWFATPKAAWVEHLAINAFLYAFWILVFLTFGDLFMRIKGRLFTGGGDRS